MGWVPSWGPHCSGAGPTGSFLSRPPSCPIWWPGLVYGNFLKDRAANPGADGIAARAPTPAWPGAPAAHIPHLFGNTLSLHKTEKLRENGEEIQTSQPSAGRPRTFAWLPSSCGTCVCYYTGTALSPRVHVLLPRA